MIRLAAIAAAALVGVASAPPAPKPLPPNVWGLVCTYHLAQPAVTAEWRKFCERQGIRAT